MTDYFISKERRTGRKLIDTPMEAGVVSGDRDERFLEREATFLFLFFLQPYLNGKGFYYFESKPNHATGKRMDVVVTNGITEFIIELKVWRGQKYQENAYQQLTDYMDNRGAEKGYLLTFDFRKSKEEKQEWLQVDGKTILEVQI